MKKLFISLGSLDPNGLSKLRHGLVTPAVIVQWLRAFGVNGTQVT